MAKGKVKIKKTIDFEIENEEGDLSYSFVFENNDNFSSIRILDNTTKVKISIPVDFLLEAIEILKSENCIAGQTKSISDLFEDDSDSSVTLGELLGETPDDLVINYPPNYQETQREMTNLSGYQLPASIADVVGDEEFENLLNSEQPKENKQSTKNNIKVKQNDDKPEEEPDSLDDPKMLQERENARKRALLKPKKTIKRVEE